MALGGVRFSICGHVTDSHPAAAQSGIVFYDLLALQDG